MIGIQLFLLEGRVAPDSLIADVEHLKKVRKEKIAPFLEWVRRYRVLREAYTDDEWRKISQTFGLAIEELNGALRFGTRLFASGVEINRSELTSDLKNLGFKQKYIELIISKLESLWAESEDWLRRQRPEAIPDLVSLRWRVDVRYASSNYLKNPEVVALLRIGTHDGTESECLSIELDKDKLSWLETVVGKIKREFLKAEENLSQTV